MSRRSVRTVNNAFHRASMKAAAWSEMTGRSRSGIFCLFLMFVATPAAAQEGTITGQVTDGRSLAPLVSAQVFVAESSLGTLTGSNGRFTISNVTPGTYELRARRIGYESVVQTVVVAAGQTVTVDFQLSAEVLALDQILVTGTAGQARRREVGNTIAQINVDQVIEPITSVQNLLQARAPSMIVNPGAGTMGGGAAIRLRGNASLSQSNQPLIYVDGVRQGAQSYPTPTSSGVFYARTHATANPLNDINPADIDRIEVIRGAAATTLYGSEAASGVIQIFTKRGSEGAASLTYQTNHSFGKVAKFGSAERPYLNMEPYFRTTYDQQHSLSVRGGTPFIRYFASGQIQDGHGFRIRHDEQSKANLRANLTIRPLQSLSIDINTMYSQHEMQIAHTGNNLFSLEFNAHRSPQNTVGSTDPEVIARLLDAYIVQDNTRFNTGLTANYTPTENFTHRFTLGLDQSVQEVRHVTPFGYIVYAEGYIDERRWKSELISFDYVGSYRFQVSDQLRSLLSWGGQSITTDQGLLSGFGRGLPGPGEHTLSSTAVRQTESSRSRIIDTGAFLQNMFDFQDKYFLTVGARVDGNSTFGGDFGLQVYPKASASWVVSDENFWSDSWGQFRLRGAFGLAGRAPGPFDAVRTWQPRSFDDQSAFIPANIGNPDLGPETSREIEVGFESSLLDNRMTLDVNYYHQKTEDALLAVPQLPSQGFLGSQLQNVGELQNSGLEVSAAYKLMESQTFGWNVGTHISTNSSEILDTGGQTYSSYVVGQPAPVIRCDKVLNATEFAEPEIERDAFCGPSLPTLTLGLSTDFTLPRGIQLSARGEYVGGHTASMGQSAMVNRGAGSPVCDPSMSGAYGHVGYFDYDPNHPGLSQVNALDRVRCYSQTQTPGIWYGRADFIKLRDVSVVVPLTLPRANNASMTVSVNNIRLWTHSDYPVFDPEMGGDLSRLNLYGPSGETTPAPWQVVSSFRVVF
jgi:TonB-dependent starch-binding outer membrane protein SusC